MDLYQIFITHNRSWSVRETIIFFLLLFLIVGLLLRQLKYGKLEKTQFFAVIALYVFVSIVFGSTVFTRTSGKRMYELIPFWSYVGAPCRYVKDRNQNMKQLRAALQNSDAYEESR